jgi:predicted nucleic acid-binding protein
MAPRGKGELFVDTLYWLALVNRRDTWHLSAVEWAARVSGSMVTTDAVLTEVADALCHVSHRPWAISTIESVRGDRQVTTISGSRDLFARAFDLFSGRRDKAWSLTDCMSFVVMKERGIDRALTADLHFVQAGFRALLRE